MKNPFRRERKVEHPLEDQQYPAPDCDAIIAAVREVQKALSKASNDYAMRRYSPPFSQEDRHLAEFLRQAAHYLDEFGDTLEQHLPCQKKMMWDTIAALAALTSGMADNQPDQPNKEN